MDEDYVMKDQLAGFLGKTDADIWFDWADHAKGLDPELVMKGKLDHIKQFEDAGAFAVLPVQEVIGKPRTSTSWENQARGEDVVRCRFVAREFARDEACGHIGSVMFRISGEMRPMVASNCDSMCPAADGYVSLRLGAFRSVWPH